MLRNHLLSGFCPGVHGDPANRPITCSLRLKAVEGALVVGEVAAVVHAGHHSAPAAPATGAAECPWPEMVKEITAAAGPAPPAEPLDGYSPLPRRRRAGALPDAARDPAELPGPMDDGPGPGALPARPDLDLLAQVLRGLRRMA